MRRKNRVYWIDHDHWGCGRHLPAGVLPASIERCWLCPNKRPPMADRPAPPAGVKPGTIPGPSKKKARRPAKPKMVVAKSAARTPPASAPPPKRTSAPAAVQKSATKKPVTKASKPAVKKERPASPPSGDSGQCAWHECSEIARPRSKYCSRNCSNKNARSRHKARK